MIRTAVQWLPTQCRLPFPSQRCLTAARCSFSTTSSRPAGRFIARAVALAASGASSIDAIVIPALFPPELVREFGRAGIYSVRSTNSMPHPTSAISLDDLLVRALRREAVGMAATENSP